MRERIQHNQVDMEEVLEVIMDLTLQILNNYACHLNINDEQNQGLVLVSASANNTQSVNGT